MDSSRLLFSSAITLFTDQSYPFSYSQSCSPSSIRILFPVQLRLLCCYYQLQESRQQSLLLLLSLQFFWIVWISLPLPCVEVYILLGGVGVMVDRLLATLSICRSRFSIANYNLGEIISSLPIEVIKYYIPYLIFMAKLPISGVPSDICILSLKLECVFLSSLCVFRLSRIAVPHLLSIYQYLLLSRHRLSSDTPAFSLISESAKICSVNFGIQCIWYIFLCWFCGVC